MQHIAWQPWSLFAHGFLGLFVLRYISCPTPVSPQVIGDWPLQTVFHRFHRLPFHLASSWVWPEGITNKSLAGERKGEVELIFTLFLCVILALFLAKTASCPCWVSPLLFPICYYLCPFKVANLLDCKNVSFLLLAPQPKDEGDLLCFLISELPTVWYFISSCVFVTIFPRENPTLYLKRELLSLT